MQTAAAFSSPTREPSASTAANSQLHSPPRTNRRKKTGVPSVTPRRFRRFFTPRSEQLTAESDRPARVTLGPLEHGALNRQFESPDSLADDATDSDAGIPSSPIDYVTASEPRHAKRRRHTYRQHVSSGTRRPRPPALLFPGPDIVPDSSNSLNRPLQPTDEASQDQRLEQPFVPDDRRDRSLSEARQLTDDDESPQHQQLQQESVFDERRRDSVGRAQQPTDNEFPQHQQLQQESVFANGRRDSLRSLSRPLQPMVEVPQQQALQHALVADNRRSNSLSDFFRTGRSSPQAITTTQQALAPRLYQAQVSLQGCAPTPVRKLRNRGFLSQLLDREHGFSARAGQGYVAYPAADGRVETASFYSGSDHVYACTPLGSPGTAVPFSLASCHSYPVSAIGDEQGFVRFISTKSGPDSWGHDKLLAGHKIHANAIMALDFSPDDSRIASASGDRSGCVIDMVTESVAVKLGGGHWDTLRQVAFRPDGSSGNVLATSDRVGCVQMWDLRCSSLPSTCFSAVGKGRRDESLPVLPARTVNTIDNAHRRKTPYGTPSASVTAIQWLPGYQSHLLLTGSEANASIKLWDTRFIKPRRQAEYTPVAVTAEPSTHQRRSYGITSMALSTDAQRLYAVCKDSTVYTYSTPHLMLGSTPDLSSGAHKRRHAPADGLGPIFGLRHDALRVASFYVKCAVRPAVHGQSELLAVGSSDSCAVIFPTDERYARTAWAQQEHMTPSPPAPPPTPLSASSSFTWPWSSPPSLPISRIGTSLIRGHTREVTSLSWSCQGRLVSASDDFAVRHWQQDAARARHLRQVGEFGGERHMAGWAHVEDDWDAADDCDDKH